MQLASEMRPCRPSAEEESDDFLKFMAERRVGKDRWESINSAREKKKFVGEVAGTFV